MFSLTTLALLASTVLATPVYVSHKARALAGLDFEIVNLARNLESLELNYWNQGLNNFTAADFAAANFTGFRSYIELFRDNEIAHFTALNNALGGGFQNCTYKFPVTNVRQFLDVAQVITTVGEGAFLGGIANLTDSPSRLLAGGIIGNEARQNSKLREEQGQSYLNAIDFDTPLTAAQAYSLAKPFFPVCPLTNPAVNFPVIPPLTAALARPIVLGPFGNSTGNGTTTSNSTTTGQNATNIGPGSLTLGNNTVNVSWNASSVFLGTNVFITFLNNQASISAPLTQTSNGTGTTQLPAGLHGVVFLVATNFNGGGPIPDAQNFAIGYVNVS